MMAEVTDVPPAGNTPAEPDKPAEQTVPYERFQQANAKAKAEAEARKASDKKIADLTAALEERENAGLPELERMKKDLERERKQREIAEQERDTDRAALARSKKERWVRAAAKDFTDPDDAVAFLNLDDLEDERDAERAVKQLAKTKKHLLKGDEPQLPGRVLQNGQPAQNGARTDPALDEAYMLSNALKDFVAKQ
jgi:hypothetical protein